VERRRVGLDDGIARASVLLQDGRDSSLDDLANQIMSRLAPIDGYQDDVALLLYRHPTPLEMDFPAHVGQLAPTRTALRSWLTRAGVHSDQIHDVLIAAGEAVANAIEHGHRDRPEGIISLRATVLSDQVQFTIADSGSWKAPQPVAEAHRGRGITLMRALMQDIAINPDSTGTTVHLSARIT
jgi:anti-sigma regulatory factor (Ser/Thr protein kinase)